MKNKVGIILLIIILLTGIYTSISSTLNASEPIIENISYSPEKPAPGSTVKFNATVIGNNISVHLIVKECQENGVCFIDFQNVTMNNIIGTNTYQAEVTLRHDDATKVEYYLNIESGGIWNESKLYKFNLSVKEDHVTENNTPGFEFVYLAISFILILFIYKRKRLG